MEKRLCKWRECDQYFAPKIHNQKFCQVSCKQKNERRVDRSLPEYQVRECEWKRCATKFTPAGKGHKFCSSECQIADKAHQRRGLCLNPTPFGDFRRATPLIQNGGCNVHQPDILMPHEVSVGAGRQQSDTERLQIAILEEAVSFFRGTPRCDTRYRARERKEAAAWLRGEHDGELEEVVRSSACFDAAGINQESALFSLQLIDKQGDVVHID